MSNPAALNVVIVSVDAGIGRTLRMALRGVNVRNITLAATQQQMLDAFSTVEPHALAIYVEGPENDPGLELMRFIRRSPQSPNIRIPIVAVSPRREMPTINAVINAGGHEYVLFPASGDTLLKKILAAWQTTRPFIEQPNYVGPCRRRREDKGYTGPERRADRKAKTDASAE
jgi:two-component system, chemotaxis family, chemotaxis protein CheY